MVFFCFLWQLGLNSPILGDHKIVNLWSGNSLYGLFPVTSCFNWSVM